ncbi:hypothetical protein RIF29_23854 [Crotalaria pallida]|uniref:Chloride channel protein n=1 Tax=Crotalaria pallida TaxID=3830 RepID=A0AAN9EJ97_CROPI
MVGGCGGVWLLQQQHNPPILTSSFFFFFCIKSTTTTTTTTTATARSLSLFPSSHTNKNWRRIWSGRKKKSRRLFCIPQAENKQPQPKDDEIQEQLERIRNSGILSSCVVGLLTGVAVVLFNTLVHEIRDLVWDGIPSRGLRESPLKDTWLRLILVPSFGGLIVSLLNSVHSAPALPFLKALAASFTLGTGNSLGPEGPSVDIGTSIANAVTSFSQKTKTKTKTSSTSVLSLRAAGSAAGLSSGFNAAVAGCFFAVESVLWPSSPDGDNDASSSSSLPLTNTTSMVILSSVIASVVSEIGLGSQPAFKVPDYDFRSPGELPLYLLLGILCGLVSLALSRCTSYMITVIDNLDKATAIPRASFPVFGGLSVGLIALLYPEILYWGFENVDILLESRPLLKGLSTGLLLQLIAVKIVATSLCRASGLVGGYYAPSLFIGAATGMAYGKLIAVAVAHFNPMINLSVFEVASPQAYGLVGMAATLAGVCQVPLTAVLLLFELTQDYRIVLPLLGAVGLSTWVSSVQTKRGDAKGTKKLPLENSNSALLPETSSFCSTEISTGNTLAEGVPYLSSLCQVESSICVEDDNVETTYFVRRTIVSEAMKTRYVTVSMYMLLVEVIDLMLAEKQSCAVIVDTDGSLIGFLTLGDIQEYGKFEKARSKKPKELLVSELCLLNGGVCSVPWTATPDMELLYAQKIMKKHGVDRVPVVRNSYERAYPVGILDGDSISITCSALAIRQSLG